MKTFVVQLDNNGTFPNNEPFTGSFGHYKSATIRIKSPADRSNCYLRVKFRGTTTVSMIGIQFKYDTSLNGAIVANSVYTATFLSNTNYYIYIPGVVDHDMVFSDITLLDTFDASIDTGETNHRYEGLDIDSTDLMKLSMVRDLALRYSVRHPHYFNEENFIYFTKLQRLFIGSPGDVIDEDKKMFETVILPDGVMRSLTDINWEVKILPKNFSKLDVCQSVILQGNSSWRNLFDVTFTTPSLTCVYIQIINTDPANLSTILRFLNVYATSQTTITPPY